MAKFVIGQSVIDDRQREGIIIAIQGDRITVRIDPAKCKGVSVINRHRDCFWGGDNGQSDDTNTTPP